MDSNLYDEFGNYIGPDLQEDEEPEDVEMAQASPAQNGGTASPTPQSNKMEIVESTGAKGLFKIQIIIAFFLWKNKFTIHHIFVIRTANFFM